MDKLNVSQLVWFLNESFTKKTSGKSKNDIVKDTNTLNISVEEFRSQMKEFFDRKGYGKGLRYATGGIEVFFYPNIQDGIFMFCYYINYERENLSRVNLSRVVVEFLWDFEDENELCMDLEVVVNNRIRFFGHKVDLNSFDDLKEQGLRKDGKNLYSVKETELSLPLLIKMQQFLEKLVEKASKVHLDSLDVAFRNALTDKEKIDVVKDFFF